jgi:hypothetical protein
MSRQREGIRESSGTFDVGRNLYLAPQVLQAMNLSFFSSSSLSSTVDNTVSTEDSSLSYKRALLYGVGSFIVEGRTR